MPEQLKLTPQDAIEQLAPDMARFSRKLGRALHDREDLMQEMCVAILEEGQYEHRTLDWYKRTAWQAGVRYLGKLRSTKCKEHTSHELEENWPEPGSAEQNGVADREIDAQALPDEDQLF